MKKILIAVALFFSMAMVSCGSPSADSIVKEINSCNSIEELMKIAENKDYEEAVKKMTPEDQQKVANAAMKKGAELAGDSMKDAFENAGDAIKDASENTSEAMKKATESASQAMKGAIDAIGE